MYATTTTPSDRALLKAIRAEFGTTAKTRILHFIYLHGGGDSVSCGLSYNTLALHLAHSVRHIKRVIKQLVEAGLLRVQRGSTREKGNLPNCYAFTEKLRRYLVGDPLDEKPPQQPRPAVTLPRPALPRPNGPAKSQGPQHITPGDHQEPDPPHEPRQSAPDARVTSKVVVVVNQTDIDFLKNYYNSLTKQGVPLEIVRHFRRWLKTYERDYIAQKIEVLAEYLYTQSVKSPAGFLHAALKGDWQPNGDKLHKNERERDYLGKYADEIES